MGQFKYHSKGSYLKNKHSAKAAPLDHSKLAATNKPFAVGQKALLADNSISQQQIKGCHYFSGAKS